MKAWGLRFLVKGWGGLRALRVWLYAKTLTDLNEFKLLGLRVQDVGLGGLKFEGFLGAGALNPEP